MFGGDATSLQSVIASDATVAGLGSFSGREGTVSARWLAAAVRDGRIRRVLDDGARTAGCAATAARGPPP
jgi:hypothetical protein